MDEYLKDAYWAFLTGSYRQICGVMYWRRNDSIPKVGPHMEESCYIGDWLEPYFIVQEIWP
jgi:hypothetical protein